jgi:hypothetical protein
LSSHVPTGQCPFTLRCSISLQWSSILFSLSAQLIGRLKNIGTTRTKEKENKSIIFKIKCRKKEENRWTNLWRLIESFVQSASCVRFQVFRIIHYRDNTGGPFLHHRYLKTLMYCRDNLHHYRLRASLYIFTHMRQQLLNIDRQIV